MLNEWKDCTGKLPEPARHGRSSRGCRGDEGAGPATTPDATGLSTGRRHRWRRAGRAVPGVRAPGCSSIQRAHHRSRSYTAARQCIELYPDKPIYDIPAVPVCTGARADREPAQADRPSVRRDLPPRTQEVTVVERQPDGASTSRRLKGTRFPSRARCFIAGGVGSFQPRPLRVEGWTGTSTASSSTASKNPATLCPAGTSTHRRRRRLGGARLGARTSPAAVHARARTKAESVILIHRRDGFSRCAGPVARCDRKMLRRLRDAQFIDRPGHRASRSPAITMSAVSVTGGGGVTRVVCRWTCRSCSSAPSPSRSGRSPDSDLALERKQIVVNTTETRDQRAGHLRRRRREHLSGQEEADPSPGLHDGGASAAFGAAAMYVFPEKRILQHRTTTGPKLHPALGVETPEVRLTRGSRTPVVAIIPPQRRPSMPALHSLGVLGPARPDRESPFEPDGGNPRAGKPARSSRRFAVPGPVSRPARTLQDTGMAIVSPSSSPSYAASHTPVDRAARVSGLRDHAARAVVQPPAFERPLVMLGRRLPRPRAGACRAGAARGRDLARRWALGLSGPGQAIGCREGTVELGTWSAEALGRRLALLPVALGDASDRWAGPRSSSS